MCPDRWLKYCTQALSLPPPQSPAAAGFSIETHTNTLKLRKNSTFVRFRRMLGLDPLQSQTTTPCFLYWERSRKETKYYHLFSSPVWPPVPHPRWSVFPSIMDAKILHYNHYHYSSHRCVPENLSTSNIHKTGDFRGKLIPNPRTDSTQLPQQILRKLLQQNSSCSRSLAPAKNNPNHHCSTV